MRFFPEELRLWRAIFHGAPRALPHPLASLVLAFEPVEGTPNGRKRVFRAVAAASSVVEWIFLAFPLAAGVTRLRLKYLLVDFATMGTDSLSLSLLVQRLRGPRKIRHPEKKFYVTFLLRSHSPLSLVYLLLFISTDFDANFPLFPFSFPSSCSPVLPRRGREILVGKREIGKNREGREG